MLVINHETGCQYSVHSYLLSSKASPVSVYWYCLETQALAGVTIFRESTNSTTFPVTSVRHLGLCYSLWGYMNATFLQCESTHYCLKKQHRGYVTIKCPQWQTKTPYGSPKHWYGPNSEGQLIQFSRTNSLSRPFRLFSIYLTFLLTISNTQTVRGFTTPFIHNTYAQHGIGCDISAEHQLVTNRQTDTRRQHISALAIVMQVKMHNYFVTRPTP